jgi:ubiquinone/menaquinone biosynthesis C-methylase UbiE
MHDTLTDKHTLSCELFLEGVKIHHTIYNTHLQRYFFARKFARDSFVLDVACGVGYGSNYLSKMASQVVGGDLSSRAIQIGKKHNERRENLDLMVLDGTRLPFKDSAFDVVLSFETIEHIKEYERLLKEYVRVLKEKGTLVLSTPNKDVMSPLDKLSYSYHVKEFGLNEIITLVQRYFGDLELFGQIQLSGKSLILRLTRTLVACILNQARLGSVALSLSKIVYRQGWSPTTFRSACLNGTLEKRFEVLPLRFTPEVVVIVCRNPFRSPGTH